MPTISMSREIARRRAKHHAPDAPESVDADLDCHVSTLPREIPSTGLTAVLPRFESRCRGVKPKCSNSSLAGAEAPKLDHADRRAPSQADVAPPAIAARPPRRPRAARPAAARCRDTAVGCASNTLGAGHRHDAHARARAPRAPCAASAASATSEPVAISTQSGAPSHVHEHVAAPRDVGELRGACAPGAAAPGGVSTRLVGPSRRSIASAHGDGRLDRIAGPPQRACSGSGAGSRGARSAGASGRPRRGRSSRACRPGSTPLLHQRRHAHGIARVVGEHQERAADRQRSRRAARCRS